MIDSMGAKLLAVAWGMVVAVGGDNVAGSCVGTVLGSAVGDTIGPDKGWQADNRANIKINGKVRDIRAPFILKQAVWDLAKARFLGLIVQLAS